MSRTLQLLLLFVLAGTVMADAASGGRNNVTDGPHSCGGVDVPYPFGITDGKRHRDFRDGFELWCKEGKPVLPVTGDGPSIPLGNFSIERAEVRAQLPVVWQCFNDKSKVIASDLLYLVLDQSSVYRISNTRNDLFVLGCNSQGYLGSKPDGDDTDYTQFTAGCLSYCNSSDSPVNGSCSGVGCCHVDIPPDLLGNAVGFDDMYNHSDVFRFSPCDYVFVAEKDYYTFNVADLNMHLRPERKRRLMPVTLDWAIRDNLTCKEAKKKKDYACKSFNSLCLNATNGPGYMCKCRRGYEGNPYTANGCTDINECERLGPHYHCKGICKNKQGSYECTCSKQTSSADPYTEECREKFPRNAKIIVGLAAIIIFCMLMFMCRQYLKLKRFYDQNGGPVLKGVKNIRIYSRKEVKQMTNNYTHCIGEGHFGKVYKGTTEDKQHVAIKIAIKIDKDMKKEFTDEVIIQSEMRHKNIVRLLGCCLEMKVPRLVYEYEEGGSLYDVLFGLRRIYAISVDTRLGIAFGLAEGLTYMHSAVERTIRHGDVKSENILLGQNFTPKVSDFGTTRLLTRGKDEKTNLVIGDRAYIDPAYMNDGIVTQKSDVYSFGVILIELITRRPAVYDEQRRYVANFVQASLDKEVRSFLDTAITSETDIKILEMVGEVAVDCLRPNIEERLDMKQVEQRLNQIIGMSAQCCQSAKYQTGLSSAPDDIHMLQNCENEAPTN